MSFAARRMLLRAAPAAALLLAVTACSAGSDDTAQDSTSSSAPSSGREKTPASTPSSGSDRNTAMNIQVTLDGRPVKANLNDSPAARDLAELLPLTIELKDFHGTERVGDPPRKLDTSGAPEPVAAKPGDLAYYAPWGNLALFYRNGPAADADLLILGHIDADADRIAEADRITIEASS
ncbi:cyclophilin-like fold protein [Streptomyces sp. WG-D5]